MSLTYTDPTTVVDHKFTDVPRSGQTVTGYGRKVPTRHMIRIATRWHRVYMMQYGNAGSPYVLIKGEVHHLDTNTEHLLSR